MARHSAMQTVPKFMLESNKDIKKQVSAKLLNTLMNAMTIEALFGETIVSMGPLTEEEDQGTETISFRQAVNLTPLVRCRKCKNWDTEWEPSHAEEGQHFCPILGCVTEADFYCASGK